MLNKVHFYFLFGGSFLLFFWENHSMYYKGNKNTQNLLGRELERKNCAWIIAVLKYICF